MFPARRRLSVLRPQLHQRTRHFYRRTRHRVWLRTGPRGRFLGLRGRLLELRRRRHDHPAGVSMAVSMAVASSNTEGESHDGVVPLEHGNGGLEPQRGWCRDGYTVVHDKLPRRVSGHSVIMATCGCFSSSTVSLGRIGAHIMPTSLITEICHFYTRARYNVDRLVRHGTVGRAESSLKTVTFVKLLQR